MFKYKKLFLVICTLLYIILTLIETVKYLLIDSNIYGLIYLFMSLFIIFLIVPLTYNYKRHYSVNRISKMIIIIILGFFSSYLLNIVVINNLSIIDSSLSFNNSIFIIKNILKPILYCFLILFVLIETKCIDKLVKIYKDRINK